MVSYEMEHQLREILTAQQTLILPTSVHIVKHYLHYLPGYGAGWVTRSWSEETPTRESWEQGEPVTSSNKHSISLCGSPFSTACIEGDRALYQHHCHEVAAYLSGRDPEWWGQ